MPPYRFFPFGSIVEISVLAISIHALRVECDNTRLREWESWGTVSHVHNTFSPSYNLLTAPLLDYAGMLLILIIVDSDQQEIALVVLQRLDVVLLLDLVKEIKE